MYTIINNQSFSQNSKSEWQPPHLMHFPRSANPFRVPILHIKLTLHLFFDTFSHFSSTLISQCSFFFFYVEAFQVTLFLIYFSVSGVFLKKKKKNCSGSFKQIRILQNIWFQQPDLTRNSEAHSFLKFKF